MLRRELDDELCVYLLFATNKMDGVGSGMERLRSRVRPVTLYDRNLEAPRYADPLGIVDNDSHA
ncbi:MAG: hypothetical protein JWL82_485 [Parcubacteria group bacterium]|nr:hypothetical protein [Parcubacteria group bacterium]